MSDKPSTEELLLAERVLARAEIMSNPSAERARLGLRKDVTNDELREWQRNNSTWICIERVMNSLTEVATFIRSKR